jgi:hypothetical protein
LNRHWFSSTSRACRRPLVKPRTGMREFWARNRRFPFWIDCIETNQMGTPCASRAAERPHSSKTDHLSGNSSILPTSPVSAGRRSIDCLLATQSSFKRRHFAPRRSGAAVSLDPAGFWRGWQRHFFFVSIAIPIRPGSSAATDHAINHR